MFFSKLSSLAASIPLAKADFVRTYEEADAVRIELELLIERKKRLRGLLVRAMVGDEPEYRPPPLAAHGAQRTPPSLHPSSAAVADPAIAAALRRVHRESVLPRDSRLSRLPGDAALAPTTATSAMRDHPPGTVPVPDPARASSSDPTRGSDGADEPTASLPPMRRIEASAESLDSVSARSSVPRRLSDASLAAAMDSLRHSLHSDPSSSTAAASAGSQTAPPRVPRHPHVTLELDPHRVAEVGAEIRKIDDFAHSVSARWKAAVWRHTMASTRLEELLEARDALTDQIAVLMSQVEAEKEERCVRAWLKLCDAVDETTVAL